MANNLAMYVTTPRIDLGESLKTAAALRAANTSNQLGELQLNEAQGRASALDQYRTAQGAGDPNAVQKLGGYPDLQGQVVDSIAHLDEANQRKALQRGQKVGRAALEVMNLPAGSPERKAEWNKQLDVLRKEGIVSDDQYEEWKDNPNDLVLHEAVNLGRTYDQLITDRDKQELQKNNQAARNILLGVGPDTIRSEEGFRANGYWDKNAWRAGYGSDTITRADGSIEKVTENTVITEADAERDLQRRLPEFAATARGQVGTAWDTLGDPAQAALSSVAYNYGSLPDSVRDAARSGDPERIAKAVEKLTSNPERRAREAALIRGQAAPTEEDGGGADRRTQLLSVASDTTISKDLRQLATTLLKEKDDNKFPTSYEDMTADQKLKIDELADARVKANKAGDNFGSYEAADPAETDRLRGEERDRILKQIFGEAEAQISPLMPELTSADIEAGPEAYLKAHPELAQQYNQKYGAGAAEAILKGQ